MTTMPLSGPEVLGPAPRDPAQKFWDPEAQTMDPERRRALQEERLRTMLGRILQTPVPLLRPPSRHGCGVMLSGSYEYFGLVNSWVPPPDTDELAEQGIRMWMRIKPDIPFVGFSLGRYFEVSAKLGLDPFKDVGLRIPEMGGPGKGSPLMTAGLECYAYLGGPCGQQPGAHLHEDWAIVQA